MISGNAIITAAHCVTRPNDVGRTSGTNQFIVHYFRPGTGRTQLYSTLADWYVHRGFDVEAKGGTAGAANTDIAIIRFPHKLPNTTHRDYLRLYADVSRRLRGAWLAAYGAGQHTYSGASDQELRTEEFKVENVKQHHIVIDTRSKVGLCVGDSGGPLIYSFEHDGQTIPTITAVASGTDTFALDGDNCSSNTLWHDDAFYARTNWPTIGVLLSDAGMDCDLERKSHHSFYRCFPIPVKVEQGVPSQASGSEGVAQ